MKSLPGQASAWPPRRRIGFGLGAALLVCLLLAALSVAQQRQLDRDASLQVSLQQALNDLGSGSLHFTLGNGGDSPWNQAQGRALLRQGLREIERLRPGVNVPLDVDRRLQQALSALLALIEADEGPRDDGRTRLAVHGAIDAVHEFERQLQQITQAQASSRARAHYIALGLSLLALAGITFALWRAESAARAVTAHQLELSRATRQAEELEREVGPRSTALEQALAERTRSDAFTRAMADRLPLMVGYWSRDLRCEFANTAYREHIGEHTAPGTQSLIGMHVDDVPGDESGACNRPYIEAALSGRLQSHERQSIATDGQPRDLKVLHLPYLIDAEVQGFFVLISDITELRAAQRQLEALHQPPAAGHQIAAIREGAANAGPMATISEEMGTPTNVPPGLDNEALLRRRHAGTRVLLAEDHPINQEIASQILQGAGLQVDVAADGHEALEMFGRRPYALVLMDMQMPRLDGLAATREIRRLPHGAQVPILAMTANVFADDRAACIAAGMNDFISKPVDPDTLYGLVLHWLAQPLEPLTAAAAPDLAPAIEGIDVEHGLRQLRGDVVRYTKLLQTFAQHHGADIAALRAPDGAAGLIASRLHALKGSASAIGATELQRQASTLDARLHEGVQAPSLAAELARLADDLQGLIGRIETGLRL